MKCPFCFHTESKVTDSRLTEDGNAIRRRRECISCSARFTTFEREEPRALFVVKKDFTRQRFDRKKLLAGFLKACEKRPVSVEQIESSIAKIEREIRSANDKEVLSEIIGAKVMEELRGIDAVAYIRFASVYMHFDDVESFNRILDTLPAQKTEEG